MPVTDGYDNKGFVGGGQGGCQYQTGSFLWGIEGDWSSFSNSVNKAYNSSWHTDWESGYANRTNATSLSLDWDSLWSVRAKFGLITQSDFMLYGTVGIGGEKASYDYASRYNSNGCYDDCDGYWNHTHSISGSVGATPTGIVAGVGADWKIYNNWILGVLYLHYARVSNDCSSVQCRIRRLPGGSGHGRSRYLRRRRRGSGEPELPLQFRLPLTASS